MKTSSCTLCIQHCTLHNTTRREGSKEGHADFFPFVEISPDEYFRFSLAGFHVRLRLDDIANLETRVSTLPDMLHAAYTKWPAISQCHVCFVFA